MNTIGHLIRVAQTEKGWSQQELADRLQCTQARVSNMERGAARIDFEYLQQVAKALDRSVYYFCPPPESVPEELAQLLQLLMDLPPGPDRDVTIANMVGVVPLVTDRVRKKREKKTKSTRE
ncbi:MAG: helix-turn-helix transcriptional regulator [Anaerolineae bacterium]|nr:helix-turn-helix transcriptional regulator [Anaerolineae bacterium]